MITSGQQIVDRRAELGLSREKLAERLGTTMHKVWRMEKQGPRAEEIPGLIEALEMGNFEEDWAETRDRLRKSEEMRAKKPQNPEIVGNSRDLPCPPRFATQRTPSRPTYGGRVADIAAELGTPLMPWQRHVVDVAMEIDPKTKRLKYRTVILTVPRQSGKTTLLLSVMVQRCLATQAFGGPQKINYTAQTRLAARKKWEDEHVPVIERSAFGQLIRVRKAMAMEAILWANGSIHSIVAGTEKSGHGDVLDMGVIDEAFAQYDHRLEQAFKPAMQTRPFAQLWIVSTAGDKKSTFLRAKVDMGREMATRGENSGICYFEWSADDDWDPGSVETWKKCMPALKHPGNPSGTTEIEVVAADYASMDLPEFKRAYLNLWDTRSGEGVIPNEDWDGCYEPRSKLKDPFALAFDISPDHVSGAIAAGGRSTIRDDLVHLEIIDHRSGTGWMLERIIELYHRHSPSQVVCDAAGPAGSLIAGLASAGIEVRIATTRDHTHACGMLLDDILGDQQEDGRTKRGICHINQPELNMSVQGSDRRQVQDAWLWARRSSNTDISPLVAATLARWGYETAPELEILTNPALSVW